MVQKIFLTMLGLLLIGVAANAQSKYKQSDFKSKPIWISMMNDLNVNYYEAVEAFIVYFSKHLMPRIEEEEMGKEGYKATSVKSREEEEREREEREEIAEANKGKKHLKKTYEGINRLEMAMAVKKFKQWMLTEKSWVQPDGRCLSEQENKAIVDKQQQELQEIERKTAKNKPKTNSYEKVFSSRTHTYYHKQP
ncbi:MAG: hypothetical protein IPN94_23690 [Sphingobacteriales bacterium]|nr:hypothetical protein [Sphingobacteriales bacterium]